MSKKHAPGRRARARRWSFGKDNVAESKPPFGNKQGWLIFGFQGPDATGARTLSINDLKVARCGRDGIMHWLISRRQIEQLSHTPGILDALKLLNTPVTRAEFEVLAGVRLAQS